MAGLTVADASVLIAYLDSRDAHHAESLELLTSVTEFHVHPVTLAEVLVHPARLGRAAEVEATLLRLGMRVTLPAIDPVALAEARVATGLKMPDCLVLATARRLGAQVATFDHRLAAAASD